MFTPYKNSYLQLVCSINPRVINKAVDQAMQRLHFDPHTENLTLGLATNRSTNPHWSSVVEYASGLPNIGETPMLSSRRGQWVVVSQPSNHANLSWIGLILSPRDKPLAQRLDSMQPSLYAPHVDITRAQLGFGRVGLRIINRELHSSDNLVQLQALHSVLDQVQISENAMFLINLQVVYRLIDLMMSRNPVIKEKVCMILTHLANYYQGRKRILSRPKIIENLMWLIMRERREIRYAAAYTLRTLTRDRCASEVILAENKIVDNLLKMVKNDHTGIVLLHLRTLENLIEWDQVKPLKANAFQVMLALFKNPDSRIISAAMDCMARLCIHDVGKKLADEYDLTYVLRPYLLNKVLEVRISAVGLMAYTTLTTRSKWRAKESCEELTRNLVHLCHSPNSPILQLRCMQVLINLCDCPDIRSHMRRHWDEKVKGIRIRTHEQWDGTTETTSYGLKTGHNYRTMCIEGVETIKNDYGDNAEVLNVHSYLGTVQKTKDRLIYAIHWKSYKH